jgi:hypothetical protein
MTIEERVKFEQELSEFAGKYGLELIEMPSYVWYGGWVAVEKSGTALWPNYSQSGDITAGFTVQFKPKIIAP